MPFSCALVRWIPYTPFLSASPLIFVVHLSSFRHVTLDFFLNLVSPGIQESEEDSLKLELFPIEKCDNMTHSLWFDHNLSNVSSNSSNIQ